MPSSLLPSRSARIALFISPRIFSFISSRLLRTLARNFLRLVEAGFLGIDGQPLYGLGRVQDSRMQIVDKGLLDPGADELSRFGFSAHDYHALDFGRLGPDAPAQAPLTRSLALDQHFEFPPDEPAVAVQRDLGLCFHQPGAARPHHPRRDLNGQVVGGGILLARISEDPEPIEALLAHEIHQAGERRLGLAGKADSERGALRDPW